MWRLGLLRRGDLPAIILGIGFLLIGVVLSGAGYLQFSNFGFGPSWYCTSIGKGEPVCVERAPQSITDTSRPR